MRQKIKDLKPISDETLDNIKYSIISIRDRLQDKYDKETNHRGIFEKQVFGERYIDKRLDILKEYQNPVIINQ